MNYDYDYIIAGGGCAGLSLAYHWQQTPLRNKRVLILDKTDGIIRGKTWSFWTPHPRECPFPVWQSYHQLQVVSTHSWVKESVYPWRYLSILSEDFSERVWHKLAFNPQVVRQQAEVLSCEDHPSGLGAVVHTSAGDFTCRYVFNSIPTYPTELSEKKGYHWIKQHFLGWRIRTERPVFDPMTMTLMDFRMPQEEEVRFMYILPYSDREALIEFTVFSEGCLSHAQYEAAIQTYLAEQYVGEFQIVSTEKGVIPMTDYPFAPQTSKYVISMGTAAGATKASTGYTFSNIQRHVQELTHSLIQTGVPTAWPGSHKRFRFYDRLLLNVIEQEGQLGAKIFTHMFARNSMHKVLRFLSEKTQLREEVLILLRLPWAPFLRALWRVYLRPGWMAKQSVKNTLTQPIEYAP